MEGSLIDARSRGSPEAEEPGHRGCLVILGIIGLAIAGQAYPTWEENKNLLEWKEAYGSDIPQDHDIVERQTIAVLGGLLLGVPILIAGVLLMSVTLVHNARLAKRFLPQASITTLPQPIIAPSVQTFCNNCGAPMSNPRYRRACGKIAQELKKES